MDKYVHVLRHAIFITSQDRCPVSSYKHNTPVMVHVDKEKFFITPEIFKSTNISRTLKNIGWVFSAAIKLFNANGD